eukprot:scpid39958/ scgid3107/ 
MSFNLSAVIPPFSRVLILPLGSCWRVLGVPVANPLHDCCLSTTVNPRLSIHYCPSTTVHPLQSIHTSQSTAIYPLLFIHYYLSTAVCPVLSIHSSQSTAVYCVNTCPYQHKLTATSNNFHATLHFIYVLCKPLSLLASYFVSSMYACKPCLAAQCIPASTRLLRSS